MLYTVGEMSKRLGISASAIRYYDREGILPFVQRSSGGIRMLSEQDYEWLKVVECLKKSGLSIREIKAFTLIVGKGDATLTERLALFRSRRDAVQKQIEDMRETLALLDFKCWYYEQAVRDGTDQNVHAMTLDEIPEQYRQIKAKMDAAPSVPPGAGRLAKSR